MYFAYLPYQEAVAKYDPQKLRDGFNMVDVDKVFYVSYAALGLCAVENDFS